MTLSSSSTISSLAWFTRGTVRTKDHYQAWSVSLRRTNRRSYFIRLCRGNRLTANRKNYFARRAALTTSPNLATVSIVATISIGDPVMWSR